MPVGIVIRRAPGVTRWARWTWKAVAVLPGAGPADWAELRRDGEVVEYHAGTLPLTLYASDTEAYLTGLASRPPAVYAVMEEAGEDPGLSLSRVTASPYEAQDHLDSGEEIVEPIPMPDALIAWITAFCDAHHREEPFIKRRRDKRRIDLVEDGKGDARIRQTADVYRAPGRRLQ
ncbi:MAG: DUF3305 domain-containing protein [Pseudomonadota bacterium]